MSQWHVELICQDAILLFFLTTCLQEPSCTVIEKNSERFYILERDGQQLYRSSDLPEASKDKHYYWLSTDFEQYINAQDVLMYAQQQLPLLNSILRLKYGIHISSLNVDDVYRVDEQDRLVKETALVPPVTGRRVTSKSLLETINAQQPHIAGLWHIAQKYPEVEEVMRHFANQWNWFNLYKVYEIIEHDVGKTTLDRWSNNKTDDFTYSANNAHASGFAARHSSARFKASPKRIPMSLPEGTDFITGIFLHWVRTK